MRVVTRWLVGKKALLLAPAHEGSDVVVDLQHAVRSPVHEVRVVRRVEPVPTVTSRAPRRIEAVDAVARHLTQPDPHLLSVSREAGKLLARPDPAPHVVTE